MKLPNRNKVRLAERQAGAAERQAVHAALSPAQRLAKLDQRLGKGAGAVRERLRLQALIQKQAQPVSRETAEAVFGVVETKAKVNSQRQRGRDPRSL